jgi:hypothetical protein
LFIMTSELLRPMNAINRPIPAHNDFLIVSGRR